MKHIKLLFPEFVLVGLVFLFGVYFRLWLIQGNPQPLIYDQAEYESYATRIMHAPYFIAAHSYRTYPYPLFIAIIYSLAGYGNVDAVYQAQAYMDASVGVMLYMLIRLGCKNKIAALLSHGLYSVNPITAGYVGVMLSEVLSCWTIALTLITGLWFVKKPIPMVGVVFGIVAGLAASTRNAAFIWAGIPIVLTVLVVKWKQVYISYAAIVLGLIISVLYPLIANYQRFGEVNITTVDDFYAREFFNGVVLKRLDPFTKSYPPETGVMFYEYYTEQNPNRTTTERRQMAQKYIQKAWARIWADPWDYIKTRFFKMWYMWQKENIFFYYETEYEWRRHWIYAANLILLGCSAMGIMYFLRNTQDKIANWIHMSLIGSLAYATLVFSISHAEYRITVPYYPILYACAGFGILLLSRIVRKSIMKFLVRRK